jgi:hypothetical protein
MSEEQPALQQETNGLPIKRRLPTWREMNMDTSPEAEAVLFKLWRETPAWRKWELMEDMNRTVRQLTLVGLRRRHPNASHEELQRRLADLLLGEELAAKVYGPIPE